MYTPAHVNKELEFPGLLVKGSKGKKVRQLQEWLSFNACATVIDGVFGAATARAVSDFQTKAALKPDGMLDPVTWGKLVEPMARVLRVAPKSMPLDKAILQVAKAHLAQYPVELGGPNAGPWVRLYCEGNDGPNWLWCAGFVSFVMAQACAAQSAPRPVQGSVSCDSLAAQAQQAGRFVRGTDLASGAVNWAALGACALFLVRNTATDWTHTGLAFGGTGDTFTTIEGNTDHQGSSNGYEVCSRTRAIAGKDFIVLT